MHMTKRLRRNALIACAVILLCINGIRHIYTDDADAVSVGDETPMISTVFEVIDPPDFMKDSSKPIPDLDKVRLDGTFKVADHEFLDFIKFNRSQLIFIKKEHPDLKIPIEVKLGNSKLFPNLEGYFKGSSLGAILLERDLVERLMLKLKQGGTPDNIKIDNYKIIGGT